jgi:protocatechuate 3,4-dioxygenase beta subunit
MENNSNIPRRKWLKLGFGLAAGTFGSSFIISKIGDNKVNCLLTPRQELGPFPVMKFRSQPDHDIDLTEFTGQKEIATGKIIVVQGKVLNTDCNAIAGAIVEIWQANHHGKYHHEYDLQGKDDPNFQGWGQAITNTKGEYRFKTILPGQYSDRTRHIHFKVSKRGYHEMVTQLYFDGEERNKTDGLLNSLTHKEQLQVIRKLNRKKKVPSIEFTITMDKVIQGGVPEKVLAEYAGKYELQYKNTFLEKPVNELFGGPYEKIILTVENEGTQLYFTVPFAPKIQVFWKAKDRFDAVSFHSTELYFFRDSSGKVNELNLKWPSGENTKGTRVSI